MSEPPRRRRSIGPTVVAVVFALLALSAAREAIRGALRPHDEPPPLSIMQAIVATLAALSAVGAWRGTRWGAWTGLAYGLVTGGMILSLGALLDMDAAARRGLWAAAIPVIVFGIWAFWYLRRAAERAPRA